MALEFRVLWFLKKNPQEKEPDISLSINHNLLLKKLYAYGIRGSELSWFTDYLAERKMREVVD